MKLEASLRRTLATVVFSLGVIFEKARCAELALEVNTGSRYATVAGVRANRIVCRDGNVEMILPTQGEFRLAGDLVQAAKFFTWESRHLLVKPQTADDSSVPARPYVCVVRVARGLDYKPIPTPIWFFNRWPDVPSRPGLLVYGWLQEGKISKVHVEPLVPEVEQRLDTGHVFLLTEQESHGRPVVLFWLDGRFVPPVPQFVKPSAIEAMHSMMLGDISRLRRGLEGEKAVRLSGRERGELIYSAADAGILPALSLLLERSAGLSDLPRETLDFAIGAAARSGRSEAVTRLAAVRGWQANDEVNIAGLASLHGHTDVALRVLNGTKKLSSKDADMALCLSLYAGQIEVVYLLQERGAQFDPKMAQAGAALVEQTRVGRVRMVRWLLENKVDPNHVYDGETALVLAAKRGDATLVTELLKMVAKVDLASGDGMTPLLAACANGRREVATILLVAGADPRKCNASGASSLHYAVEWDDGDMAERLLEAGADVNAETLRGVRPLEIALRSGFARGARQLAKRGARLSKNGADALAPIEAALMLDVPEVIEVALKDGWSPETTFQGWPAISVAQLCGADRCVALLAPLLSPTRQNAPIIVGANVISSPPTARSVFRVEDPRPPDPRAPFAAAEVEFVVDAEGRAVLPRATSYSDPRLSETVLKQVVRFHFNPATIDGAPVAMRVAMPMNFFRDEVVAWNIMQVTAPPVLCSGSASLGKPPFSKNELKVLSSAGIELTVGLLGQVEQVTAQGLISPKLLEKARNELSKFMYSPGLSGDKIVRTRMKVPFFLWLE